MRGAARSNVAPPLPLQGERVGVRGPVRALGVRGWAPSSRPSPPEGGEGARTACPPYPPPLFQRVNNALDSSRSPASSAIATSPLSKAPPRLPSASRASASIDSEEARIA